MYVNLLYSFILIGFSIFSFFFCFIFNYWCEVNLDYFHKKKERKKNLNCDEKNAHLVAFSHFLLFIFVMRRFRVYRETKMREFSVGERVLATWADGRKYPAKVNAVLTNGKSSSLA